MHEKFPSGEVPEEPVSEQEPMRSVEASESRDPLPQEVVASADKGILNSIARLINSKVEESKLPTKEGFGYESTMGIYGGKLAKDEQGKMVYDTRGFWSRIDQWGDRIVRSFDEHHMREPGKMLSHHPKIFLKYLPLIVDSKRYRGTPEQTMENVKRFGLEDFYGAHPWGIEIKKPDVFSRSIGLQDIFRQDQINSPVLNDIDRFEALASATEYMHELHDKAGGIAEGNAYSFLFTEKEGNKVQKPIIMIPTEVYNPEKHISDIEQKTTDLLDLMASAGTEEHRRSKDWESVRRALGIITGEYNDPKVIAMVASYVKRGRLTLAGDTEAIEFETSPTSRAARHVFALHNKKRLSTDADITAQLRKEIVTVCERYAASAHTLSSEEHRKE